MKSITQLHEQWVWKHFHTRTLGGIPIQCGWASHDARTGREHKHHLMTKSVFYSTDKKTEAKVIWSSSLLGGQSPRLFHHRLYLWIVTSQAQNWTRVFTQPVPSLLTASPTWTILRLVSQSSLALLDFLSAKKTKKLSLPIREAQSTLTLPLGGNYYY